VSDEGMPILLSQTCMCGMGSCRRTLACRPAHKDGLTSIVGDRHRVVLHSTQQPTACGCSRLLRSTQTHTFASAYLSTTLLVSPPPPTVLSA
jgi:hypothetical protein